MFIIIYNLLNTQKVHNKDDKNQIILHYRIPPIKYLIIYNNIYTDLHIYSIYINKKINVTISCKEK